MTTRALNASIKTVGEWFVPEEPSHRVPGVLEYDGQVSLLDLSNSFEPVIGKVTAGHAKRYPVVHGATVDLGAVTLFDAVQLGLGFNIVQGQLTQPERLRATMLIVGRHVDPDTLIKSMEFRIPGLEVWLSQRVILSGIAPPTNESRASQTVHIMSPAPEVIKVPTIDGTVTFEINVPMSISQEVTRFSIAATATLTITSNTGQNLAWFLDHYKYIEALIALFAGCPMPVDQIQARFTDQPTDHDVLLALPKIPHCTATTVNDFFVFRNLLGSQFDGLVQRWFADKSKLQLPVGLAANVLASQDLWTHLEFLSLLQALEGFHRATLPDTYMAEADYESVKKALGDALPSTVSADHRSALKSKIRYGNEYSLQKRMNKLVKALPDRIHKLAIGIDGDFPRPWIDTRNFFTHWDKELEPKVVTGQALYEANVRLRVLLRLVYLNYLGIDAQMLEKALLGTNPLAQHLIQLNFPDTPLMEIKPQNPAPAPPDLATTSQATTDPDKAATTPTPEAVMAVETPTPSSEAPKASNAPPDGSNSP